MANSLLQMAQKALIKNVRELTDIGNIPYDSAIRPVLLAIDRPDQLRTLEQNCSQIAGKTGEIWVKLIKRDVEKYAKESPPEPADPTRWYKVYRKLVKEHQQELAASEEQLRATMDGLRNAKKQNQTQCRPKEELPKEPKVYGMQYAPTEPKPKKPPPPPPKTDVLRFGGGSRTKTLTGHGLMQKIRREGREAALIRPGGVLATPNHLLSAKGNASRITKAPLSMGTQQRNSTSQRPPLSTINRTGPAAAASRLPAQATRAPAPSPLSTEERERRRIEIAKRRNAAPETRPSPPPPIAPNTSVIALAEALSNGTGGRAPEIRRPSPEARPLQPSKKKRPAPDPFMPAKRRKGES